MTAQQLGAAASARKCTICGDPEPSHVHNGGERIERYFTVGRRESEFQAALRWRGWYEQAERERDELWVALERLVEASSDCLVFGDAGSRIRTDQSIEQARAFLAGRAEPGEGL